MASSAVVSTSAPVSEFLVTYLGASQRATIFPALMILYMVVSSFYGLMLSALARGSSSSGSASKKAWLNRMVSASGTR